MMIMQIIESTVWFQVHWLFKGHMTRPSCIYLVTHKTDEYA